MHSPFPRGNSGQAVYGDLQAAGKTLHQQSADCLAQLHQHDESTQELVQRRGEALVELARHYFPEMSREAVAATFHEVRTELADVLFRKQRRERQLGELLEQYSERTAEFNERLTATTAALDEKVAQREQLEQAVAERLKVDPQFQNISQQSLAAEQQLNRNEQRIVEIRQEAAEKLPAYEKSKLFKYLYDRQYGTPAYDAQGWTKRWDQWVARMIEYGKARRSYDFLRSTPELVEAEVARRRINFNCLMEQLEAIEDRFADELGLTQVMREGQQLGSRRDQIVADLAQLAVAAESHHGELRTLGGRENEFYRQAIDKFKQFLAGLAQSNLEQRAQSTPQPEDDQVVAEIKWLNDQLEETARQIASLGEVQRGLEQRENDLQQVVARFRRAEYDSARSVFPGTFDVQTHLERFLASELSGAQLWSAIETNQHFLPPWYDDPRRRGGPSVFDGDLSYVLLKVLVDAAGQAMQNAAYRGAQRRGPFRQQTRSNSGRPTFRHRGYTRGRGF